MDYENRDGAVRWEKTELFRFHAFSADNESVGAGNTPDCSKRGNFEAHCENIGVELKSCLPGGKPARRWRGKLSRGGSNKRGGKAAVRFVPGKRTAREHHWQASHSSPLRMASIEQTRFSSAV